MNKCTAANPAVRELEAKRIACTDAATARLRVKHSAARAAVPSDKLGEVAAEFDAVHNIGRARQVGSVHERYRRLNCVRASPRLLSGYGSKNGADRSLGCSANGSSA